MFSAGVYYGTPNGIYCREYIRGGFAGSQQTFPRVRDGSALIGTSLMLQTQIYARAQLSA
jgi:hypothetical protein